MCFQRAITILDVEKRLSHCLRKRLRCGVEKNLGTAAGEDLRQCFRFASFGSNDDTTDEMTHEMMMMISDCRVW